MRIGVLLVDKGVATTSRNIRPDATSESSQTRSALQGECNGLLWRYADLRTALSTSVLPSDQIAPGTLWLPAITSSNEFAIQLQSSSVMTSGGSSLMVWLP